MMLCGHSLKEKKMTDVDRSDWARLPTAVYDLAMRLGAEPKGDRSTVCLSQSGRMLRSLDATTWMSFEATQTISTRHCFHTETDRSQLRFTGGNEPLALLSG